MVVIVFRLLSLKVFIKIIMTEVEDFKRLLILLDDLKRSKLKTKTRSQYV